MQFAHKKLINDEVETELYHRKNFTGDNTERFRSIQLPVKDNYVELGESLT